jgi:hypothetical protein
MPALQERIAFDPGKVRFDLPLSEAFALTQVRSLREYYYLRHRLPELQGISYFFINVLDKKARLVITIITAEDQEITATFVLDHCALGIAHEELIQAGREDGNYPVPGELMRKIKNELQRPDRRFFKAA